MENSPIPYAVEQSTLGEHTEDGNPEPKKRLRQLLGLLAGSFAAACIFNWHAFRTHGLKAVRFDHFLLQAFGSISLLTCLWLVQRQKESTTLGIGDPATKKLR
jgi:hypothetical protein